MPRIRLTIKVYKGAQKMGYDRDDILEQIEKNIPTNVKDVEQGCILKEVEDMYVKDVT